MPRLEEVNITLTIYFNTMSSHYVTEPSPTASIVLNTTVGPIPISLFANQTPLACRNFLQHILDGYYTSTTFHRVVPGFVVQAGDPTGTGEGGQSIYDDREFEIDPKTGEKLVFGDELHSRLKFNRRGLLGMAKMGESTYGSQFFITLADTRAQLDGKCTMFGRVEGDGIYNVVRIAEAENVENTERPLYPFKITGAEILEMPKGEPWASMKKRDRMAKRTAPDVEESAAKKRQKKNKKGKPLLSFGEDEGDKDPGPLVQTKPKFNTRLINAGVQEEGLSCKLPKENEQNKHNERVKNGFRRDQKSSGRLQHPESQVHDHNDRPSEQQRAACSPQASPHGNNVAFHDPSTQLPLKNPESPSHSSTSRSVTSSPRPTALNKMSASSINAKIATLKTSMRRDTGTKAEKIEKKTALEQLIPETSIRGRKRPPPGHSNNHQSNSDENAAFRLFGQFKAKLESADHRAGLSTTTAAPASAHSKAAARNAKAPITNASSHQDKPTVVDERNGARSDGSVAIGSNDDKHEKASSGPTMLAKEDDDDNEAHLCDLHFIANCQSCSKWDQPKQHHRRHNRSRHLQSPRNKEIDFRPHTVDDCKSNAVPSPVAASPTSSISDDDDNDDDGGGTGWMTHALSFAKDRLGKDLTWKQKNEEELLVIDPREKEREIWSSKLGTRKDRERGKAAR